MMFREQAGDLIAISQPSHAWLAGQVAKAWGNARFGPIEPFDDVTMAAAMHDAGWMSWETAPQLNPRTGRPYAFYEMDVVTHIRLWSEGVELVRTVGQYPALLVSMHGTRLYRAYDFGAASPGDAAIVRAFIRSQTACQRALIEAMRSQPRYAPWVASEAVARNSALIAVTDRLSLVVCQGAQRPVIIEDVPLADGNTRLVLTPSRGGADFTVEPWPFGVAAVTVRCEGRHLATRYRSEAKLHADLRGTALIPIKIQLCPPTPLPSEG